MIQNRFFTFETTILDGETFPFRLVKPHDGLEEIPFIHHINSQNDAEESYRIFFMIFIYGGLLKWMYPKIMGNNGHQY